MTDKAEQEPEFLQEQVDIERPPWIYPDDGKPDNDARQRGFFLDALSEEPSKDRDEAIFWLRDLDYGGCASGQYMPAVTYCEALETMGEHGDEVLQYLEDYAGDIWPVLCPAEGDTWAGIAVKILSAAVEEWAGQTLAQIGVEQR